MPETEFTLGIEEEYQIIDADTRALRPRSNVVLEQAQQTLVAQSEGRKEDTEQVREIVQHELYLSQIETASPVCHTLADIRARLQQERGALIAAARQVGSEIVAAGTHPFSHWREQELTPKERYAHLDATFQQIAHELIIFGCHVGRR